MRNKRLITSDGILRVLSAGGQVQYRPVKRNKRWEWALWARYPNDEFVHVISSKTAEPRYFKSSNGLFAFHLRLFPESEGVFIPATINATHEWDEKSRGNGSESDFHDTE